MWERRLVKHSLYLHVLTETFVDQFLAKLFCFVFAGYQHSKVLQVQALLSWAMPAYDGKMCHAYDAQIVFADKFQEAKGVLIERLSQKTNNCPNGPGLFAAKNRRSVQLPWRRVRRAQNARGEPDGGGREADDGKCEAIEKLWSIPINVLDTSDILWLAKYRSSACLTLLFG